MFQPLLWLRSELCCTSFVLLGVVLLEPHIFVKARCNWQGDLLYCLSLIFPLCFGSPCCVFLRSPGCEVKVPRPQKLIKTGTVGLSHCPNGNAFSRSAHKGIRPTSKCKRWRVSQSKAIIQNSKSTWLVIEPVAKVEVAACTYHSHLPSRRSYFTLHCWSGGSFDWPGIGSHNHEEGLGGNNNNHVFGCPRILHVGAPSQ